MPLPLENRKILSVSALTGEIKKVLSESFGFLWVSGEVSNLSQPASGHLYFSLKDSNAQIRCAMFRSRNQTLSFAPENGMQVLIYARPDLYAVRGDFQLIVESMELSGAGKAQAQFEALKAKLSKEGLFDKERKLPIPTFPHSVGIISSLRGAAIKDILKTLSSRFIPLNTIVYPATVQGNEAPAAICHALQLANRRNEVDVIILARGGGGYEDLQAFNDEQLVRAIVASTIPIISGIGHDIDFTLADFAADLRTATPTAAAHASCPDKEKLGNSILTFRTQMQKAILRNLSTQHKNTDVLGLRLTRSHPLSRIEYLMQKLDGFSESIISTLNHRQIQYRTSLFSSRMRLQQNAPSKQIAYYNGQIEKIQLHLSMLIRKRLNKQENQVSKLSLYLKSLNPLAVLSRGFSITTTTQGKIIRDPKQISPGRELKIRVEKGVISAIAKYPMKTDKLK